MFFIVVNLWWWFFKVELWRFVQHILIKWRKHFFLLLFKKDHFLSSQNQNSTNTITIPTSIKPHYQCHPLLLSLHFLHHRGVFTIGKISHIDNQVKTSWVCFFLLYSSIIRQKRGLEMGGQQKDFSFIQTTLKPWYNEQVRQTLSLDSLYRGYRKNFGLHYNNNFPKLHFS